ncbi:MAG: tetratricopeptide repeat protein [Mangrovibacterium sp.]
MRERHLKILFFSLAFAMLAGLLLISRDAGISGDEEVHYRHAEDVYDYYASLGKDQDALSTPKTHLQYYGQSPDVIATILAHWLGIEDIYGFRHLFGSFIGWLTIFMTAWFTRWLKGYGAAIFSLLLFAVSPSFLGHLQNNLKDIPFALAYIAGVYYILRLTYSKFKSQTSLVLLLVVSIAFSVSIRAGGILLVFYLLFAGLLYYLLEYIDKKKVSTDQVLRTVFLLLIISSAGYLAGLLLWPYALQNPIVNPWKSYQVMTHFPITIQQIFEGKFIWSDHHPWYYLPKYMLITIPLVVFAGLVLFLIFSRRIIEFRHRITYGFLIFSVVFPVLFVILKKANLYGAWRHFIFVYPGLVLLSAVGLYEFFSHYKQASVRGAGLVILAFLIFHPLKFMVSSHPYYYLYYNQFTGGLKGAYGKYETDYYYHTMRSGAEWLQKYLEENEVKGKVIIGSNFSVSWYLRNLNNVRFQYFTWQQRNDVDWDYAIIGNSYIRPEQLRKNNFPPEGTIHTVLVDGVPMCAVVARKSKLAVKGARAFEDEDYAQASEYYQGALKFYKSDEHIYYKLGKSLSLSGRNQEALEAVNQALAVNEMYEPALKLAGQLKTERGDYDAARKDFEKLIRSNKKYFSAYVELAKVLIKEGQPKEARETLKACLMINSRYKPAIITLGDTFRESDPEIASKYYELANSITTFN